ncbi:MAG TPA: hypothetical protein VFN77_00025 [Acetobacteraceae bacterium]|nr:hypothetical protein [Acetobacteraceae bacterium]
MALFEDFAKDASPTGLMTGIGVVLLTPVLAPAMTRVLRPTAKGILSAGITLYRGVMEPVSDAVGNLVAEAQLELAAASARTAPEGRAAMAKDTETKDAETEDAGTEEPEKHKRGSSSRRRNGDGT